MKEPVPSPRTAPGLRLGLALALAAVTLALFWPATGYDFLNFDDGPYVFDNPRVLTGFSLANVRWAFTTINEDWWLPMLWLSYMADADLLGPGPFGFHLVNVLLHALNATLLFWVLCRMTNHPWRSALVAALFALHPLRVESVAWVAERKDVLSGLFFLLGLLAYRRYTERPDRARLWTLPLCMLLGLMSKGILIVFPFVLLLLDFWPLRRATALWGRAAWPQWKPLLREKSPLFALAGVFVAVNLRTHSAASPVFNPVPLADRLGLVFPNYWAYLRQIFWPLHVAILHPENDVVHWPLSFAALVGLAVLTALAWRQRARRPFLLAGWLWFLLILLPVVRGLRYSLASIADRFTYLPSIGLAFAAVWFLADLGPAGRRAAAVRFILTGVLLAALAMQTRAVLPLWRNSEAAFGHALLEAPEHALVNNNYGLALLDAGRIQDALPHLEKAAANRPDHTPFTANLGIALVLLDRPDEAILRLENARLKTNPDCAFLNFAIGLAWLGKNDSRQAIPCLQRALAAAPDRAAWRMELARAFRDAGREQDFSNEMARAATDGFPLPPTYNGLVLYYLGLWEAGHAQRAWVFFQRALQEHPGDAQMMNNVAWYLATVPPPGADPAQALELARAACQLEGPDNPGLLDTLAAAQAANKLFEEAVQTAEDALRRAQTAGNSGLAGEIAQRLDAYRRHQPWRM